MSLLKLFATLGLALARQAGAGPARQAEGPPPPTVGVPFGCGLSFEVSQAHNTGSHLHNDSWAWDFRMPVGVPIVAARAGLVRMARGDSTTGGCDPKLAKHANYVVIDHGDGTETQYLHFASVVVKAGQKVNQGELLGYSGKTGWSCGSHLHFKVARRTHNGWNNPSVPAHIQGYGDPVKATLISAPACAVDQNPTIHAEGPGVEAAPDSQTATVEPEGGERQRARDVLERALLTRPDEVVVPALEQAGAAHPALVDVAPAGVSGYTTGGDGAR